MTSVVCAILGGEGSGPQPSPGSGGSRTPAFGHTVGLAGSTGPSSVGGQASAFRLERLERWERVHGLTHPGRPLPPHKGTSSRRLTGDLTATGRLRREEGRAGICPSSLPIQNLPGPPARLIHFPSPFLTELGVGWGGGEETHHSGCPRGRGLRAPGVPIPKSLGPLSVGGTQRPGALSL